MRKVPAPQGRAHGEEGEGSIPLDRQCNTRQMAEGFVRKLARDGLIPVSAGIESPTSNPPGAEVMKEVGVDISVQRSKDVAQR